MSDSRNTARTRPLKIKLVQAFGEARRAAVLRGTEYLPTYHALHNAIQARTAGSSNEKFVHPNVNRLINQTAGINAGQRPSATVPQQSMLIVAQTVATQAMQQAPDHPEDMRALVAQVEPLALCLVECLPLAVPEMPDC